LLRGYGGDEPLVHRRLVPEAVVVADRDRVSGAQRAGLGGARVLVLDDAFQHLGVRRDLNILVVSAESAGASPWTLPAGPWRESWGALERADWVVVTRRHASIESARGLADRIASRRAGVPVSLAHLALTGFEGLASGQERPLGVIAGRQVVAAAGVADPATFAAQLGALGAGVQLVAYADHHAYSSADVGALLRSAARADYVVVTEKDAVKLRGQWPRDASEPLVARMQVSWEHNQASLERALDAVSARAPLPQLPR